LKENGFCKERIVIYWKVKWNSFNAQYFDFFEYDKNKVESFVDAGVFDGSSSYFFAAWCQGNYRKIWGFEPNQKNYELASKKLKNLGNVIMLQKGLSDMGVESFNAMGTWDSFIAEKGNSTIQTIDLDTALKGEEVTFIKMDIEGAEYSALCGAKEILLTQKLKLAICVYHKAEDIIDIPELILSINPEYKLALRHYSTEHGETLLYAY